MKRSDSGGPARPQTVQVSTAKPRRGARIFLLPFLNGRRGYTVLPGHAAVQNPSSGFSLLEMLVVLAIAGTLAVMAQGAYSRYAIRLRRIEGQTALLAAMQRLEQHYLATGTYGHAADQPEKPWAGLPSHSSRGAYRIVMAHCLARQGQTGPASFRTCVLLRAEPQTFTDAACGVLTLQSDGTRGTADGPAPQCW